MKFLRFALSPGFLMFVVIGLYVLTRVAPANQAHVFGVLAFSAFAAIELVTLGALLLDKLRPKATIAAHSLNAVGALLIGISSLVEAGTLPLAIGSLFLTAGLLLWQRTLRAPV